MTDFEQMADDALRAYAGRLREIRLRTETLAEAITTQIAGNAVHIGDANAIVAAMNAVFAHLKTLPPEAQECTQVRFLAKTLEATGQALVNHIFAHHDRPGFRQADLLEPKGGADD